MNPDKLRFDPENKYDKLLLLSVVLIIGSAVLLIIAGYDVFFKGEELKKLTNKIPSNEPALVVNDSFKKKYTDTITDTINKIALLSVEENKEGLKTINIEIDTLKKEIEELMAVKNNNYNLLLAKLKIEELKQKVDFLQGKDSNVAWENKRIQKGINQIPNAKFTNVVTNNNFNSIEKTKPAIEKKGQGHLVIADKVHLFAVANNKAKEQETTTADVAEKIVGTFIVKNLPAKGSGEFLIVVLQPDGKVVKNSVWDSGSFETREGKKIYSLKIFTKNAAEEKQLNFSLTPVRFLKGDYTMQIWYNGSIIANTIKRLS